MAPLRVRLALCTGAPRGESAFFCLKSELAGLLARRPLPVVTSGALRTEPRGAGDDAAALFSALARLPSAARRVGVGGCAHALGIPHDHDKTVVPRVFENLHSIFCTPRVPESFKL